jgi:hypothetical protein
MDLNTDEDGWSYSLDFGGFTTSKEDLMGVGRELQERSSVVLFDDSYKLDSTFESYSGTVTNTSTNALLLVLLLLLLSGPCTAAATAVGAGPGRCR